MTVRTTIFEKCILFYYNTQYDAAVFCTASDHNGKSPQMERFQRNTLLLQSFEFSARAHRCAVHFIPIMRA